MSDRGLKERIIEVATQLFADQGFSATSVRQVVEACSCTKPSLYYYFENKETLFSEIVTLYMDETNAIVEALALKEGPAREAIHGVLDEFADWAAANHSAMRLLQRVEMQNEEGAPQFNIACSRELHLKAMQEQIQRGQQRGELRKDLDALECAMVIAGSLSFQFEMNLGSDAEWDRDRLHRTINMIFDGIAA